MWSLRFRCTILYGVSSRSSPQKTRIIPLAIRYTRLIDESTLSLPPFIFHSRRESHDTRVPCMFPYPLKCYKSTLNVGRFGRANKSWLASLRQLSVQGASRIDCRRDGSSLAGRKENGFFSLLFYLFFFVFFFLYFLG